VRLQQLPARALAVAANEAICVEQYQRDLFGETTAERAVRERIGNAKCCISKLLATYDDFRRRTYPK
jgi:hypothetical protein